jgi:predicted helicase
MSKPLHPRAGQVAGPGLFAGLKTFVELEARIASLPNDKAKGDAFEVFAEAYLAVQRKHDAAQVWPMKAVSVDVLVKLDLSTNDYGVDGLFTTALGQFSAYQVKFRSGRQPLTWRELATFMGLADSVHIHSRVLFTNCDELPAVMNDRKGFFCIRGSDLDRLEEPDFRAIESWLSNVAVPTARKGPRSHQQQALNALLPELRKRNRVTAIMPCGSGKTLVALWIAEALECGGSTGSTPLSSSSRKRIQSAVKPAHSKILVLLPSLALLRQTLHEWLHETSLPSLAYLCVCSDPTVKHDLDAVATPQSDLDFQVSTDNRTVREFLDAPFAGAKVIFSTYQSARVVGEALRKGEAFDLGIFDEAHKTAGREGRNYAFALEDSNLPIRKRLFLTATPRH